MRRKRKTNFFKLLTNQCEYMCKGMELLYEYCKNHNEQTADEIIAVETEGDMARRILIDELNNTFITPIDREDLFDLSRHIDEILDYAKTTVDEIRLFNVTPNKDMAKMIFILLEMTQRIHLAVNNLEERPAISKEEAIKVKKLENKMGDACVNSLARLFDEEDDFKSILKYREIYRHINHTADIGDTAMDFLLNIIVKM
ncbi:MAG: DUF47 domain-containing protein [Christensenellales bacterium]|jgi:predicted phosphate transport protein (TIGR00153 family)